MAKDILIIESAYIVRMMMCSNQLHGMFSLLPVQNLHPYTSLFKQFFFYDDDPSH